jgi:stage II sporulation protein D
VVGCEALASAQALDLSAPLRVRMFAGVDISRLDINGVTIDAATGTMSSSGNSSPIGSQIVELTGNPYLDVTAIEAGGTSIQRRYPGTIFVMLRRGGLLAINQVDVEIYVASVMSAEVSPGWATESLRAQAIVVRTYAAHARMSRGSREYDLKDDTSSQVYRGIDDVAQSFVGAAQDTTAQIVIASGAPAAVFYSSSCGGHTAESEELTGQPSPSYLLGVSDLDARGRAYCSNSPYFRWKNSVSAASMARIVDVPAEQLNAVTVVERWPDGRVKTVTASGSSFMVTLKGSDFYRRALSVLGYKVIPSTMFDVSRDGQSFAFVGHGVGHGVGMCQWGARGRADAGMSASQIVQAYFPGTMLH